MLFNSLEFVLFLVVLVPLYFALKTRNLQHLILLIASLFFYGYWNIPYIALMVASAFSAAILAQQVEKAKSYRRKKWLLVSGVTINLIILGVFKYYDFFVGMIRDVGFIEVTTVELLLPLGISFYTFQSLSYIIDVARGDIRAEKNPFKVLLYVSFFPQLVAGPIVRATDFFPQLDTAKIFQWDDVVWGSRRIAGGLLKKVVIADTISRLVDPVYAAPGEYSAVALLLATYAFAIQIYCDFSGYSDIAIGVARIFGFRLNENFDAPYISQSIQEFWRRWHISLSSWLRDYLYVPLGGNRDGTFRTYRNLMITMILGGLWHGASYNFIIWGFIQGAWLSIERAWTRHRSEDANTSNSRWTKYLKIFLVFHGVCVSWVFFRAATFADALAVLTGIASFQSGLSLPPFQLLWQIGLLVLICGYFFVTNKLKNDSPLWYLAGVAAVCIVVLFGASSSEFIYFVF